MADEEQPPSSRRPRSDSTRRIGSTRRLDEILGEAWRTRVEEQLDDHAQQLASGGSTAELAEDVAKLKTTLAWLTKQHEEAPPPFHWDDLKPADRDRRWHELEKWVAEVLEVYHPTQAKALRSCWADHPASRQIVTAAWLAWGGAYRAPSRRHHDPAEWITRHLPALVAQLREVLAEDPMPCPLCPPEEDPTDA